MKKLFITSLVVFIASGTMVFAAGSKNKNKGEPASLVEDIATIQSFTDEPVPQADIEKIVNAGINAQSAINKQPWHFSVVTNKNVMSEMASKMKMPKNPPKGGNGMDFPPAGGKGPDAPKGDVKGMDLPPAPPAGAPSSGAKAAIGDSPLVIIVSAKDGSDLDAGLATELMTCEAVLLGYGTKIISSPTIVLNGEEKADYQKLLGIPSDMSVKSVILIGKYNQKDIDAVSRATTRKDKTEVVTYIK